jgi:hypothetical protein
MSVKRAGCVVMTAKNSAKSKPGDEMPRKQQLKAKPVALKPQAELQKDIVQLRKLAHDLSNSLEAILQACYLLGQVKLEAEGKRWVHLLSESAEEGARVNRDIRKLLRAMSE